MRKILVSILAACALTFAGYGQILDTNTSPPTIGGPISNILAFASAGTNWIVAGYGISYENKDHDRKAGAGIGAFYKLSDYVLTGVRLDLLDRVYMPSGNIQLQVPIIIAGKVKITPFGFAGVATAISSTQENEPVLGIFGAGLAINLTKNLYIVGDAEVWTGFPGEQYRAGLVWKF